MPSADQLALQKHQLMVDIIFHHQLWRKGLIDQPKYSIAELSEALDYALTYMGSIDHEKAYQKEVN